MTDTSQRSIYYRYMSSYLTLSLDENHSHRSTVQSYKFLSFEYFERYPPPTRPFSTCSTRTYLTLDRQGRLLPQRNLTCEFLRGIFENLSADSTEKLISQCSKDFVNSHLRCRIDMERYNEDINN